MKHRGNVALLLQISGIVPRFGQELDLSSFSSPVLRSKYDGNVSDSPSPGTVKSLFIQWLCSEEGNSTMPSL